jgi:hypothetical protein
LWLGVHVGYDRLPSGQKATWQTYVLLTQKLWLDGKTWLNWRSGGALRWKGETISWEGRGVICGKPAPSRL